MVKLALIAVIAIAFRGAPVAMSDIYEGRPTYHERDLANDAQIESRPDGIEEGLWNCNPSSQCAEFSLRVRLLEGDKLRY
jgi:hypothetical protein